LIPKEAIITEKKTLLLKRKHYYWKENIITEKKTLLLCSRTNIARLMILVLTFLIQGRTRIF